MKVCFLLTHIPNPRINKRIEVLKKCAQVFVICTRRGSQDIWSPTQDVIHDVFDIDLPSSQHLVRRYVKSADFRRKAIRKLDEYEPDVIYAEGLDTLLIACEYKKRRKVRIFFEVADLRENFIKKPASIIENIFTAILLRQEKKAFKDVEYLIITSPKFYDCHYKRLIDEEHTLYIPNLPELSIFKSYKKKVKDIFTVGFIGGIRYLDQMKMLVDASEKVKCKVLFAGAGGTTSDYLNIKAYCEGKENIQFTGKYDYDTEVLGLYESVDCVYAVYDADNPNVRIALPNKLYESIICELPIIVAKGTYLNKLVKEWNVGDSVKHTDTQSLIRVLTRLKTNHSYYDSIVQSCAKKKNDLIEDYKNIMKLETIVMDN